MGSFEAACTICMGTIESQEEVWCITVCVCVCVCVFEIEIYVDRLHLNLL